MRRYLALLMAGLFYFGTLVQAAEVRKLGSNDLEIQQTDGGATETTTSPAGKVVTRIQGGVFPWDNSYTRTIRPGDIVAKGPWFDVRAYGAVGDGTTDDTTAIQAAITAASRTQIDSFEWGQGEGGTVFLPRGVYKVTSGLTITGDAVHIVGEGPHSSSIKMVANTSTDAITVGNGTGTGRNVILRDLSIFGLDNTQFRDGVVLDGPTWPVVQNVSVHYASGNAFKVMGTIHAHLSHIKSRYCGRGLWAGATSGGTECTTMLVDHLYTAYSVSEGVLLGKVYGAQFNQPIIEYCGSAANVANSTGIVVGAASTGAATEATLVHPYFEGNYGWDIEVGRDSTYSAYLSVLGGSYRATANKQSGYGLAYIDRAIGGGMYGGYINSYAAPMKTIVFSNNSYNFTILGGNFPAALPPEMESAASLDTYRGIIALYDGNADVRWYGRTGAIVGGPGSAAGQKHIRNGVAPTTGTWAVGDIVWNTGTDNVIGWKCTVAGTPGTWKSMTITLEP